jgi:hypothetical protein
VISGTIPIQPQTLWYPGMKPSANAIKTKPATTRKTRSVLPTLWVMIFTPMTIEFVTLTCAQIINACDMRN